MSELIFCGKCKHYDGSGHCGYLENLEKKTDWYGESFACIKVPSEINKKNDCEWFERAAK